MTGSKFVGADFSSTTLRASTLDGANLSRALLIKTSLADASGFIKTLEDLGCWFALDDFGSGLSSFAYLKNLPVHFLKIDGTLVKGIVDSAIDLAMVRSIHEIAHVMGKLTIAEFVENAAILEKLRELGVDYAQGYALGRPEALI